VLIQKLLFIFDSVTHSVFL